MSGNWVLEWFPHTIMFLISEKWQPSLAEIYAFALFMSSLVRQVIFFGLISGENSASMAAFVLAGFPTTTIFTSFDACS